MGFVKALLPVVVREETFQPDQRGALNIKKFPVFVGDDIRDHGDRMALVAIQGAGRLVASELPKQVETAP